MAPPFLHDPVFHLGLPTLRGALNPPFKMQPDYPPRRKTEGAGLTLIVTVQSTTWQTTTQWTLQAHSPAPHHTGLWVSPPHRSQAATWLVIMT